MPCDKKKAQLISVIIPAYKEPFLQQTIDSLYRSAQESIEVIVVLDSYWPDDPITNAIVVHSTQDIGMRTAINLGVSQARGKYIMKCDGHCLFPKGFDLILKRDAQPKWTLVPILYGLDIQNWRRTGRRREFQFVRKTDMKGQDWPEFAERVKGQQLCDLFTSQGSCWFMEKAWFEFIGGEDDINYGGGGREAQEISLKTWTKGGRYVLDRNLWYAHWRKPRAYATKKRSNRDKSRRYALKHWQQEEDISWLIKKFAPVPSWD